MQTMKGYPNFGETDGIFICSSFLLLAKLGGGLMLFVTGERRKGRKQKTERICCYFFLFSSFCQFCLGVIHAI